MHATPIHTMCLTHKFTKVCSESLRETEACLEGVQGDAVAVRADAPTVVAPSVSMEMSISLRKAAVKQWIVAYRERRPAAEEVAAAVVDAATAAETEKRQKEAQEWIASWRSKTPPAPAAPLPSPSANGATARPPVIFSNSEVAARKAEAQEWIAQWRTTASAGPQDEVRAWIANWRAGGHPSSIAGRLRVCVLLFSGVYTATHQSH
jgi:hypothetical protein